MHSTDTGPMSSWTNQVIITRRFNSTPSCCFEIGSGQRGIALSSSQVKGPFCHQDCEGNHVVIVECRLKPKLTSRRYIENGACPLAFSTTSQYICQKTKIFRVPSIPASTSNARVLVIRKIIITVVLSNLNLRGFTVGDLAESMR